MVVRITQKIAMFLLILVVTSFLVFIVLHLIPGDPARLYAGSEATEEVVELIRQEWGFAQPLYIQYITFVSKALHGDFGYSIHFRQPVLKEILQRLPSSIELAAAAILISIVFGIPLGVASALHRRSFFDKMCTFIAVLGISSPIFVTGLLLIFVFSLKLNIFPASGRGDISRLILPAITLGVYNTALIVRLTRATMLDVLRADYIRTARAKGLPERVVIFKHALRNAIIPVYTIIGLNFGHLIGSAVIVEVVFARGGLGEILVDAVKWRDYQLAQGSMLVFALLIITVNLMVDWTYQFLDPRTRGGDR